MPSRIEKQDKNMAALSADQHDAQWLDIKSAPLEVGGLAFFSEEKTFNRLPVNPPEALRPVLVDLAKNPAGARVRFRTDSTRISIKVRLAGVAGMCHMPATGVGGFDLYVGPPGKESFYQCSKYDRSQDHYELLMFQHDALEMRDFTLYFPLYMEVISAELGLVPAANLEAPLPLPSNRKLAIYGTSIAQGGCASRPGMCCSNILSRMTKREIYNFGFSGNAHGDLEIARILGKLEDIDLHVLDMEPNCGETIRERLLPFISELRQLKPDTPILVLSTTPYSKETVQLGDRDRRIDRMQWQRKAIDNLRSAGDKHVHFLDGSDLLGDCWAECSVDGVHLTDLGFLTMAQNMLPHVNALLP